MTSSEYQCESVDMYPENLHPSPYRSTVSLNSSNLSVFALIRAAGAPNLLEGIPTKLPYMSFLFIDSCDEFLDLGN